jgi:hypothetical protein
MIVRAEGTPDQVTRRLQDALAENLRGKTHAVALLLIDEAHAPIADDAFSRLMAEADQDAVSCGHMDDSRQAMYTRMDGE